MADENPSDYQVDSVVNGRILTPTGWVPLTMMPDDAPPPWRIGYVVNGHVFNGRTWIPVSGISGLPSNPSQHQHGMHQFQPKAGKTPNWFMRQSVRKRIAIIFGGVIALLVLIAVLVPTAAGPDKQAEFLSAVAKGQSLKTDNDTQVVGAKRARGNAICNLLPSSLEVEEWTGTVTGLTTELGNDQGLVKINIGHDVDIVSDDIDPDSDVFGELTSLRKGDAVTFSGTFDEGTYCIDEESLLSANGLHTPDFSFVLSTVKKTKHSP